MSVGTEVDQHGFATIDPALDTATIDSLIRAVEPFDAQLRSPRHGGVRDVLRRAPEVARIVRHPVLWETVTSALGPAAFAVRAILFDKNPVANWKVPWHQDLTVAVQARAEVPGYGPWSVKAGAVHVQPPDSVLERMLAVRVHLDDCGEGNGALRVLAGSHRFGRVSNRLIETLQLQCQEVTCAVRRGGIVVMRPLLVHASSIAQGTSRRRVLHLEFAACELAPEVTWFERW